MKQSTYFKREELNFISTNELDPMSLIMPGNPRTRQPIAAESAESAASAKKKKGKKAGGSKSDASSLLVVALKRLLPVGLNLFAGREQELVQHCKEKFLAKVSDTEIFEFATTQLTLPDKIDPSDAMNWQHTLYSRLSGGRIIREDDDDSKKMVPTVEDTVERIVAMAKVLYGLHILDHPGPPK